MKWIRELNNLILLTDIIFSELWAARQVILYLMNPLYISDKFWFCTIYRYGLIDIYVLFLFYLYFYMIFTCNTIYYINAKNIFAMQLTSSM